jgi:hypothetical protein
MFPLFFFPLFFSSKRYDIHRLCCWFECWLNYASLIAYARDFRVCRAGLCTCKRKDAIRSVRNFRLLHAYFSRSYKHAAKSLI